MAGKDSPAVAKDILDSKTVKVFIRGFGFIICIMIVSLCGLKALKLHYVYKFVELPYKEICFENAKVCLEQLEKLFVLVSKSKLKDGENCPKNKILWVGESQNRFQCVREQLKIHGIEIKDVSNSDDIMKMLRESSNEYIAIIYDMNEKNCQERRWLRKKIEKNDNKIPLFDFCL
jgi:hypothetical protein